MSDRAVDAVATLPDYRAVILGAGRSVRGEVPPAMVGVDKNRRVLDWLLDAFSALRAVEVYFVAGFGATSVEQEYRSIRFVFNSEWETTGPARSLALAPLASAVSTFVSYSDIVFRPATVLALAAAEGDVVLAVDRQWRRRYDGRSQSDVELAEKVAFDGERLDVGQHVATSDAHAEFVGIWRLSAAAAASLEAACRDGRFAERAGVPELIRYLVREGWRVETVDVEGDWAELNAPQDLARFVLGTKAESLERLRPLVRVGHIGELVRFSTDEWRRGATAVIARIREAFRDRTVIVRSSAALEDSWSGSAAGAFKSVPDIAVSDDRSLEAAIAEVVDSYGPSAPGDQVLVQEMVGDVALSGVVMTRTPSGGAPYYVVNFDDTTRRTDTVTSGGGTTIRTTYLYRGARLRPDQPRALDLVLDAVREIEELVGHDSLDIEFAVTSTGQVHVFQVRPIAIAHSALIVDDEVIARAIERAAAFFEQHQRPSPYLVGRTTQFNVMSDWNPAEIIGRKPGRLAFSLYRYLVTDEVWAAQRAEYGYRDVRPCNLLVDVLGNPYVDVRATFCSFVPADVPDELASRLVDYYLDELLARPHLYDKVEFEVLFTCFSFDFDERGKRLRRAGFGDDDVASLRRSLLALTRNGIQRCRADLGRLDVIRNRYDRIAAAAPAPLERAFLLLEDVRRYGTPTFAHLARAGFVAVSFLRSLSATGALELSHVEAFLTSLDTVSGAIKRDAHAVAEGRLGWEQFVATYGHLRPGTYDVTSPRYASAPDDYLRPMVTARGAAESPLDDRSWQDALSAAISSALAKVDLGVDAAGLERFLREAIEGRELAKFVFTRNLSDALEALAEFGAENDVARDALAQVSAPELFSLRHAPPNDVAAALRRFVRAGRKASALTQAVCLPSQIRCRDDVFCFEQQRAEPNFVTRRTVRARVVTIGPGTLPSERLEGVIAVLPNADPGFDWILGARLAGLMTMYGGANSHMSIRAAEFQLPAAIGIGELLFEEVSRAEMVELDCASRQIRIVR